MFHIRVKFDHEAHCIFKHLTCSACNLFEDISKEERRLSIESGGKQVENDSVTHNFMKSFGWCVGAVSHAVESEDPFLARLADDLRAVYQLLAKSLNAPREESIGMKKQAITAHGKILNELVGHYRFEAGKSEGKKRKRQG